MAHQPVAYAYEANIHCPECTAVRFGGQEDDPATRDSEGNSVWALFPWDMDDVEYCGDCQARIA